MSFFSRDESCGRKLSENAYAQNTQPDSTQDLQAAVQKFQQWFAEHVTLFGQPYTLDYDQACAVYDCHKNTLVTARAGSGKTRVIVAKIAYLVISRQAHLAEIAAFMFNRTAAAEVNERIGAVKVDGHPLSEIDQATLGRQEEKNDQITPGLMINTPDDIQRQEEDNYRTAPTQPLTDQPQNSKPIQVASTFHKYALDLLKTNGEHPQIIGEREHDQLITQVVLEVLQEQNLRLGAKERAETLQLIASFIARAGQRYFGASGLAELKSAVQDYCLSHQNDATYQKNLRLHWLAFLAYQKYLDALQYPLIDFNMLMAHAAQILTDGLIDHVDTQMIADREATALNQADGQARLGGETARLNPAQAQVAPLKYILVDEYQDFSYLFFSMIQAMRQVTPAAHLFVVGDDWQAINRFAGSDVNYFINFARYFPEDSINIPLMTNYRSDRRIVENANTYMLTNYDAAAQKATAFSRKNGKIFRCNPSKVKFDSTDLREDGFGDGVFQKTLAQICGGDPRQYLLPARYLKSVCRIIQKNQDEQIMLLHRHNFTSFAGVSLAQFGLALQAYLDQQCIIPSARYAEQVRLMTMHKSKGLESDVVILLELDRKIMLSRHPYATTFPIFGDTLEAEKADQHRLLYVALTRAKHKLYLLSNESNPFC